MACLPSELSTEAKERERFKEQLQSAMAKEPNNYSGLDSILGSELERRSAVVQSRKMTLQVGFSCLKGSSMYCNNIFLSFSCYIFHLTPAEHHQ